MPVVRVAVVKADDRPMQIDLPGTIQAFDSATLFARATGYIGRRDVDIGSRVHAGDVLGVISAPELDQQLAQARAQLSHMQAALAQSQANMELARANNGRTSRLVQQGWAAVQQGDTDQLNFVAQTAAVGGARANLKAQVNRLEQLTGFERVVAPFDGVITSRQVDVGSLVTANASRGTPLFSIAPTDVLRVQVYVPRGASIVPNAPAAGVGAGHPAAASGSDTIHDPTTFVEFRSVPTQYRRHTDRRPSMRSCI